MKASSSSSSSDITAAVSDLTPALDVPVDKAHEFQWLTEVQLQGPNHDLVAGRFSQRKLGEIMVMLELLSAENRDFALEQQATLRLPFGECCIHLNLIDAEGLSQALAWQFGLLSPTSKSFTLSEDLVMLTRPLGSYAEALRKLGSRLVSHWLRPGRNVLAITSPAPGEGRSHMAANLAISLDQAGLRTLLVDADFRNPRQHINFNVPQHPGLSRLLCGFAPEEVVRQIPYLSHLSLITSGPTPPNPSELLTRNGLAVFLEKAREYYDIILIDTPASVAFSDAEMIALASGSALIIARRNRTRERDVRKLAERFTKNGVQVVGTVLNSY
ncbi:polysaccharide biosynthesis tyrosine autokinase [Lamprocystis purpurea]|jgi:receptor protein-tyrosine kinase|uniref:polysaccharide biosynthesis tyrosine autokinase n=1 Tax=Lamprocystis purpurea TaxID=61598 RepID=UPI000A079935|nr:polysaccharide biosynthesis tyrosine autokinase [Lamprocystis purpurea]